MNWILLTITTVLMIAATIAARGLPSRRERREIQEMHKALREMNDEMRQALNDRDHDRFIRIAGEFDEAYFEAVNLTRWQWRRVWRFW